MQIVILAPYPPFPPYGGGTMRIYQIVRGLAQRHTVTCLTFAADAAAEAGLAPLRELCRVETVRGPGARGVLRRAWTTIASPLPDMALRNASRAYARALRELLGEQQYDVVQAESIEMAPYLETARRAVEATALVDPAAGRRAPLRVLDQFNAEYLLQRRAALAGLRGALRPWRPRAAGRSLAGGLYSTAQWLKLAAFERGAIAAADAAVVVSADDQRALERAGAGGRYAVVPNGVDTAHFSRAALAGEGRPPLSFDGPALVFSGTLDFRPNVDALEWFAGEVLPRIRARCPGARLVAVGRRPGPGLRRLAEAGALTLTGEVADARPFIAGASAYVVPMRIGGGVRLKLLEALALEAPTVTTTMGAEGVVGLRDGEHALIADAPEAFAEAVLGLLDDPARGRRLGAAGRALVRAGYDWSVIIPRLEALYASLA